MAVTVPDTIQARAEKAVAAYIRGTRDADADTATYTGDIDYDCTRSGDLNGIPVYEGRITQNRKTPCILVKCQHAERPYPDVSFFSAPVDIVLFTHWRESEASVELPEVKHNLRAKAIYDLIRTEAVVVEAINRPTTAEADSRDIKNFHVQGCQINEIAGDVQEGQITEAWELELWCYPFDALTTAD